MFVLLDNVIHDIDALKHGPVKWSLVNVASEKCA